MADKQPNVYVIQDPTKTTSTGVNINNTTCSYDNPIVTGLGENDTDTKTVYIRICNHQTSESNTSDTRDLKGATLTLAATGSDIPSDWYTWFYYKMNSDTTYKNFGTPTNNASSISIHADTVETADSSLNIIYGNRTGTSGYDWGTGANGRRYASMAFQIRPSAGAPAGNYTFTLKISGNYT